MRRSIVRALVAMVFLGAASLPAVCADALSVGARALLADARSAAWAGAVEAELGILAAEASLPAAAFDLVIEAVGPGELPPHPPEAAAALFAAARQADAARRRGAPLPLLRAEIRTAWRTARRTGTAFTLRLDQRAQAAVAGFAAGSRRTWDPQYEGRGGSDAGAPGAGPGGRW